MLDVQAITEYQVLFEQVPPALWVRAHAYVAREVDLPKRGPKGDPMNQVRINVYIRAVVREIRNLVAEEGR